MGSDLHLSKMTFEDVTPSPPLPVIVPLTPFAGEKLFRNQPNPALNSTSLKSLFLNLVRQYNISNGNQ